MKQSSPFIKFSLAICLLVGLIVLGTFGYAWIEGWSLTDSLYMTFITMTTVGFQEVRPLSSVGQHFTILFIVLSIATAGYSASILIAFIFEGQILKTVQERRKMRKINRLRDHYIICGCGDVGIQVALEFQRKGVRFLALDINPPRSDMGPSFLFVQGDAIDDQVLSDVGVQNAKGLISALPSDEDNVFVVLSARQLNPNLTIVAKAVEDRTRKKLMKAGADRIITPYQIAGRRIASVILRPSVVDFLDVMVEGGDLEMALEEVAITKGSPLNGKTLRETDIGAHTGAIVVGIHRPDGRTWVNPSKTASLSQVILKDKDVLIAIGSDEQLKGLKIYAAPAG